METRNYKIFYKMLKELAVGEADELKSELVSQFSNGRTEKLQELTNIEYSLLLGAMESKCTKKVDDKADKARKRVMAAIGAVVKNITTEDRAGLIKHIAVRAAKLSTKRLSRSEVNKLFNSIPLASLNKIYNKFRISSCQNDIIEQVNEILKTQNN